MGAGASAGGIPGAGGCGGGPPSPAGSFDALPHTDESPASAEVMDSPPRGGAGDVPLLRLSSSSASSSCASPSSSPPSSSSSSSNSNNTAAAAAAAATNNNNNHPASRGRRAGNQPPRVRWWRTVPPEALRVIEEQLQPNPWDDRALAKVLDALDIQTPEARRDFLESSRIPALRRRRESSSSSSAAAAAAAATPALVTKPLPAPLPAGASTPRAPIPSALSGAPKGSLSSLDVHLSLLASHDTKPATKRAVLRVVVHLLGAGGGSSDAEVAAFCRSTRVRECRWAGHELGFAKCDDYQTTTELQSLRPLIAILESGVQLDPSAKRALVRKILADSSVRVKSSPVQRAALEAGLSSMLTVRGRGGAGDERKRLASPDTGGKRRRYRRRTTQLASCEASALMALLSCLNDAGLKPSEIRALLVHVYSIVSGRRDREGFVGFVLATRLLPVWKGGLRAGLLRWDTVVQDYSFSGQALQAPEICISLWDDGGPAEDGAATEADEDAEEQAQQHDGEGSHGHAPFKTQHPHCRDAPPAPSSPPRV